MDLTDLAPAEKLRKRLRSNPKDIEALNDLGLFAAQQGQEAAAETLFRRAIASGPRTSAPHVNLSSLLRRTGRIQQAHELLLAALQQFPTDARLHLAFSEVLYGERLHDQALEMVTRAHQLAPRDNVIIPRYIAAKRLVCDWDHFETDLAAAERMVADGEEFPPFLFMSLGAGPDLQRRCAMRLAERFRSLSKQRFSHPQPDRSRPSSRKLKIGYLSADFHAHATTFLLAGLLEQHDRSRFEIFAYSFGQNSETQQRRRIVNGVDVFRDISRLRPREAAHAIFKDRIDILLDLKGYTEGCRPEILALTPAPVQVNYLGFPSTMGADFIDYIIADQVVAPSRFQAACSESIVHLPGCFQPNDRGAESIDEPSSRSNWGLPENSFVFASFANSYKITPTVFETWMRLLKTIPDSVLWLLGRVGSVRRNLTREAAIQGVAPERLIFAPGTSQSKHIARHRHADLVLDTLPVSAFTTASDALWAGVPFLTCLGETPAGRGAASILTAHEVPHLITHSLCQYEQVARDLASDKPRLLQVRDEVARRRATSPLFDIVRYTRGLEASFRMMHDRRVAGLKPQPFAVQGQDTPSIPHEDDPADLGERKPFALGGTRP